MHKTKTTLIGLLLSGALLGAGTVAADPTITVYKTPTCGCCTKWVEHLRANGLAVETTDLEDLRAIKSMSGIAPEQASCHTARVDGYVIEGHVPASDIKRLLAERPTAIGLTVPGMPLGSPGMEHPNPQHYEVLLLDEAGSTRVFAEH